MFHSLCDMVLPCSKLNNSNLIKGRNINICSFQKVHKHSLIQNELVSTFTLKKISNYISFINHLYRNKEKKSNTRNTLGCIFVFKGPYL